MSYGKGRQAIALGVEKEGPSLSSTCKSLSDQGRRKGRAKYGHPVELFGGQRDGSLVFAERTGIHLGVDRLQERAYRE